MRRAPLPTASVMSDAMAPPFRSSEPDGNWSGGRGECRRSLAHTRVLGQGKNGQGDAAALLL